MTSTINRSLPATHTPGLSGDVRSNFVAAANDIEALQASFVNVKNFGAVGNGVTNDAAAFLAAAQSLSTPRGFVRIPEGNYAGITAVAVPTTKEIFWIGSNDTASQFFDLPGIQIGMQNKRLAIIRRHASDTDYATVLVTRRNNNVGGDPAAFNTGIYSQTTVNAGAGCYEWAITGEVLWSGTQGEGGVAVSGVSRKLDGAVGAIWGGHFISKDDIITPTPATVGVTLGIETSVSGIGLDSPTANGGLGNRRVLDVIAATNDDPVDWDTNPGNSGFGEIGTGVVIRTQGGANGGYFRYGLVVWESTGNPSPIDTAIHVSTHGDYGIRMIGNHTTAGIRMDGNDATGIIMGGTYTSGNAIRVPTGQAIAMEGTGALRFWNAGSVINFGSGTSKRVGIDLTSLHPAVVLNDDVRWTIGSATPEGAITATPGSIYSRTVGAADTSFYVKTSGTGTTGWISNLGSVRSVKDFGATGDGVTNDSAAIQAAMTYASTNQIEIYVPAGNYLLNSQVVVAATGSGAENFFSIRGAGANIACFIVNNTDGGFEFTITSRQLRIWIKGVRFEAKLAGSGTALAINYPEGGGQRYRSVVLDDISVQPLIDDFENTYFNNGISVAGVQRPLLTNMMINGGVHVGDASCADASSKFRMDTGISFFGCYGVDLYFSSIWLCKTALLLGSAANPGAEGFRIDQCALTENWIGCDISTPGTEPGGWICNTHINSTHKNIWCHGTKLNGITDCSLYNIDIDNESSVAPIDIHIEGADDCGFIISRNSFSYPGNTTRTHIVIDSGPVIGTPFTITDNQFMSSTVATVFANNGGVDVIWDNNHGMQGMVYPTVAQYQFAPAVGTAIKDASVINTGTITATDANIRLLAQWVQGLATAISAQNITSPWATGNMITNSRGIDRTVGTPGDPGLYWGQGGVGLTLSVVAFGTDTATNIDYVDLRWNGTSSNANFSALFASGWVIPAASGETWTEEVWIALLATGTGLTNVVTIKIDPQSYSGVGFGSFVASNAGTDIKASLTSTMQRFSHTVAIGGGGSTTRVNPIIACTHTVSAAIDITLRVGWPQIYRS